MATARQLDPTGTLTLRNRFVAEMDRRFRFLKAVISDAVVGSDIFGLVQSKTFLVSSLASSTGEFLVTHAPRKSSQKRAQAKLSRKAFAFETDQKKVEKFRSWLDQQAKAGVLSVDIGATKFSSDVRWSDQYVGSSYRKGIVDGFIDTKKAAGSALTKKLALGFGAMAAGTAEEFLRDSFSRPIHADRVAMLYTRAYDELKGITAGMSSKIGSALAQGMAEGRNPRQIASMLNKQVDLGLNRARVLARTEVIRAHAEGKLNTYESLGIQRVEAEVEFSTAKDTRVCKRCRDLHGKLFSVGTGGAKIKEKPKPAPELRPKKKKAKKAKKKEK